MKKYLTIFIIILSVSNFFSQTIISESEPNNTANEAQLLSYDNKVEGLISTENDVDYFKFVGTANEEIDIIAEERNSSGLSGLIMLFDDFGNLLANNSYYTYPNIQQRIVYILPNNGTYYIRYSNDNNWGIYPYSVDEEHRIKELILQNKSDTYIKNSISKSVSANEDFSQKYSKFNEESLENSSSLPSQSSSYSGDYNIILKLFEPIPPTINYSGIYSTTYNSVIFRAEFNSNGSETNIEFEYGTSESYGSTISPSPNSFDGIYTVYLDLKAEGLSPNTSYHYKLKAENSEGVVYSNDRTFTTPTVAEGWEELNSGLEGNVNFYGIKFTDENTGYIVDWNGILKTTDAGNTWTGSLTDTWGLYDIDFVTSNLGIVVGYNGRIIRTIDGGSIWTELNNSPTTQSLRRVNYGDANTALAVGENGTVIKTSDGGANWSLITNVPSENQYYGVNFTDANHGTIVGSNGIILTTFDGGNNWNQQTIANGWWLYNIFYLDANNGWAVGEGDQIYYTNDGGTTWNSKNLGNWYNLQGIHFNDLNNGIAVGGNGTVLRTRDGGNSWFTENSGTTAWLNDVTSNSVNDFVIGDNNTILKSANYLTLTFPNGGELWKAGITNQIKWKSSLLGAVNVDYSIDKGANWLAVPNGTGINVSLGSLNWIIPNTPSTQCKVRIMEVGGSGLSDESNGVFEIKTDAVVLDTEPNNTASEAQIITYGDEVEGTIFNESDVDYFKFYAEAGDTVEIYSEERNSSELDGLLRLYQENGNELNNSTWYDGTTRKQRIVYIINAIGNYYISYSNQNNWGSYPISVVKNNSETGILQESIVKMSPQNEYEKGINDKTINIMKNMKMNNSFGKVENKIAADNSTQALSGDYRLTLNRLAPTAPTINSVWAYGYKYNKAFFQSFLFPNGLETSVTFEYGESQSYGNSVIVNNINVVNEYYINATYFEGLEGGTTYHYKLKAENSMGYDETEDQTFTTPITPNGWEHIDSGIGDNNMSFFGIEFTDENTGFIVEWNRIMKTIDGGNNWSEVINNIGGMHKIAFANSQIGYIVGNGGIAAKTSDGGQNWIVTQGIITNSSLYDIYFPNELVGYTVGDQGTILKTVNSGENWTQLPNIPTSNPLIGVHFNNENHGVAVGENGIVLTTFDGGNTWTSQTISDGVWLRSVYLIDGNLGYIVLEDDKMYKTVDGGITWNTQSLGSMYWLSLIFFTDINNGIAVGSNILRTKDGGVNWFTENTGTNVYLRDVTSNGINDFVVGDYNTILRSTSYLTLNSPHGGEEWRGNTQKQITWQSNGITNINLEYSTDGGASWQPVANGTNISASLGTLNWSVPNSPSTNCLLIISDASNPSVNDASDAVFTILVADPKYAYLNTKIFLEGNYSNGSMSTTLNANGKIPLAQPFGSAPWSYNGPESVPSIPNNLIVDWVLVELRTGTAANTSVAKRAGFLRNDGFIVDLNGASQLVFPNVDPSANYYVVVYHRNHLKVMSSTPVTLGSESDAAPCPGIPTITDSRNGKVYNTVLIGTQCWLKENMDIGTMIQGNQEQTDNSIIEKYCYNNLESNCETYGGLYQWNEAMQYLMTEGAKGICPDGWHIPSIANSSSEYEILANFVNNDGNALKKIGQGTGEGTGTNTSGFSALLSGFRNSYVSDFENLGEVTFFWSSNGGNENGASLILESSWNSVGYSAPLARFGVSVRCIKD